MFYLEAVIRITPDDITVIPNLAQIKYISVLPISPFFEIYISPNLIWDKFGIMVMSSGLIHITGSSFTEIRKIKYSKDGQFVSKIYLNVNCIPTKN